MERREKIMKGNSIREPLEKRDYLAMIIAALCAMLPIVIIALFLVAFLILCLF